MCVTRRTDTTKISFEKDFSLIKQGYNLVQIEQGKYILNFEFNTVVNNTLTENLKVLRRYTAQDLKIDLY